MATEQNNPRTSSILTDAAKAIGTIAGKAAALAGAGSSPQKAQQKENSYQATYLGSGTFIIHKPKRKARKLRQTRLKGRVRGART